MGPFQNRGGKPKILFSRQIRVDNYRTIFVDIKAQGAEDPFLTITESIKRPDGRGYDREQLIFELDIIDQLLESLTDAINHVNDSYNTNPILPSPRKNESSRTVENQPQFTPNRPPIRERNPIPVEKREETNTAPPQRSFSGPSSILPSQNNEFNGNHLFEDVEKW